MKMNRIYYAVLIALLLTSCDLAIHATDTFLTIGLQFFKFLTIFLVILWLIILIIKLFKK